MEKVQIMDKEDKIVIRVSTELKQKVIEAADRDRRSVTQYITVLLEKELNK